MWPWPWPWRRSRPLVTATAFKLPLRRAATKPDYGLTWTEGQAYEDARQRLDIMVEFGKKMGAVTTGEAIRTDSPSKTSSPLVPRFRTGIVHWDPIGAPTSNYSGPPPC